MNITNHATESDLDVVPALTCQKICLAYGYKLLPAFIPARIFSASRKAVSTLLGNPICSVVPAEVSIWTRQAPPVQPAISERVATNRRGSGGSSAISGWVSDSTCATSRGVVSDACGTSTGGA